MMRKINATQLGKGLAQHPYSSALVHDAGVELIGKETSTVLPFGQLCAITCRRGIVWGELEFLLPQHKVVRLHGLEWDEAQTFYHFLLTHWQQWSEEMARASQTILDEQAHLLAQYIDEQGYLTLEFSLPYIQEQVQNTLAKLPLDGARLGDFPACAMPYKDLLAWLNDGEHLVSVINEQWEKSRLETDAEFFDTLFPFSLSQQQRKVVINQERVRYITGSTGSGKSHLLIAKAMWLQRVMGVAKTDIILIAEGETSKSEHDCKRISCFDLAKQILSACDKKLNVLPESYDREKRKLFWLKQWRLLCLEDEGYAKAWFSWLTDEFGWTLSENHFWKDKDLSAWLSDKLDVWLTILSENRFNQKTLLERATEEQSKPLRAQLKLLFPLLKRWRETLKSKDAVELDKFYEHALRCAKRRKFQPNWRYLFVDDVQNLTQPQLNLIAELFKSLDEANALTMAGNERQSISLLASHAGTLWQTLTQTFKTIDRCHLSQCYRLSETTAQILAKFINKSVKGYPHENTHFLGQHHDRRQLTIIAEQHLEKLLSKLSGVVNAQDTVYVVAPYAHQLPTILEAAQTKWPGMQLRFQLIDQPIADEASYLILLGLSDTWFGFPRGEELALIDEVIADEMQRFYHGEVLRCYQSLSKAKKGAWLLEDKKSPSHFCELFVKLGVKRSWRVTV